MARNIEEGLQLTLTQKEGLIPVQNSGFKNLTSHYGVTDYLHPNSASSVPLSNGIPTLAVAAAPEPQESGRISPYRDIEPLIQYLSAKPISWLVPTEVGAARLCLNGNNTTVEVRPLLAVACLCP